MNLTWHWIFFKIQAIILIPSVLKCWLKYSKFESGRSFGLKNVRPFCNEMRAELPVWHGHWFKQAKVSLEQFERHSGSLSQAMMQSICLYSQSVEHLSLALLGFPRLQNDLVQKFFYQNGGSKRNYEIGIWVHGTLTGFHCGSHSSLISLTATSFADDPWDDPIKIKAGDNFMIV